MTDTHPAKPKKDALLQIGKIMTVVLQAIIGLAIGALAAAGNSQALTKAALTQPQGFRGTTGVFRLLRNGLNQRGLAVATFQNNQVVILDQAPRSFGGPGL